jgi:predicted DNA-binding transcriptional regulator YafY
MTDARARLLRIRDFFQEHTDERHPVTARELIAYVELSGYPANRRAVYADIALLRHAGLDIRMRRRRANEYYLGNRLFDDAELRILADMVRASRILTAERTERVIGKLASLTSRYEATALLGHCCVNPLKTKDDRSFQNVDTILAALDRGGRLSFVYRPFADKKQRFPGCGAETYTVNPFRLAYAKDHYYLIADHPAREGLTHYRLDWMTEVCAPADTAAPEDPALDAAYARNMFSMAQGETRWVRLSFDRRHLGEMTDRFGADIPLEQLDNQTYSLYAPVSVSAPFFGWVFQFGGGVRITAPDDVRERMLLMLESVRRAGYYMSRK